MSSSPTVNRIKKRSLEEDGEIVDIPTIQPQIKEETTQPPAPAIIENNSNKLDRL